ncbi:hypothetical protein [Rubripirellula amarantea]|uniref:hypothetical protein n=1 Tax=Rubripirellula amarantea TaxID=2527999 RepID=UPI0011B75635|nr:hypothetical protein [Rubripirellula amarantea]
MIARFIQRLTLFAFTAHAVLGCCWHHTHAVADECGQTHDAHVVHCCSGTHHSKVDECRSHEGHHHHDGEPTGDDRRNPTTASSDLLCLEQPIGHSHACHEGHCTYIVVKLRLLDLELVPCFLSLAQCDTDRLGFSGRSSVYGVYRRSNGSCNCKRTALGRCADLQTWQI